MNLQRLSPSIALLVLLLASTGAEAQKAEPQPAPAPAPAPSPEAAPPAPAAPPTASGPVFWPAAQQLTAPQGPGCPDPALATPGRTYSAEDLTSIPSWTFSVEGGADLRTCGTDLPGFFAAEPTFSPVLTGMEGRGLSLMLFGQCDAALLVRDSDGGWHYADNTRESPSPHMELWAGLDGRIDIWSGTATGAACRPEIRAVALTPPTGQSPDAVAEAIEGAWRYRIMTYSAGLTLTQTAPGQWQGSLRFYGQDTPLHSIRVDGETGRLEFQSSADDSFCYGILNGARLDGACVDVAHGSLMAWEAYRQ